jgi:hypothetical protein
MAEHTLTLQTPAGDYLETLGGVESLDMAYTTDEGVLNLTLPPWYTVALFRRDCRIHHTRKVAGALAEDTWLIRDARDTQVGGASRLVVQAFDLKTILRRRIVFDQVRTGAADDLMKAFVREAYVTATDTDRRVDLLTVAPDIGAGPSVSIETGERQLLDVLQDLAAASLQAGTYLAFDVVPSGDGFQFQTYPGVRGRDLTSVIVLSVERGTLADVATIQSYIDEATFVYARGRGEADDAIVKTASDAARIGASPFGRIEAVEASNATTEAGVQAAATHGPTLYHCRVEPVQMRVDASGRETIDVQLRSDA